MQISKYKLIIICFRYSTPQSFILNKLLKFVESPENIKIVDGENYSNLTDYDGLYEFSGYLQGLTEIENLIENHDAFLILNDTIFKSSEYLLIGKLLRSFKMAGEYIPVPVVHGLLDKNISFNIKSELYIPSAKHIRSNMFLLNRSGVNFFIDVFKKLSKGNVLKRLELENQLFFVIKHFLQNDYHNRLHENGNRKFVTIFLELLMTHEFFNKGVVSSFNKDLYSCFYYKFFNLLKRFSK